MKFVTNFAFTFEAAQGVDTNVVTAMMVGSTFIILCKNHITAIVKHRTTDSMLLCIYSFDFMITYNQTFSYHYISFNC